MGTVRTTAETDGQNIPNVNNASAPPPMQQPHHATAEHTCPIPAQRLPPRPIAQPAWPLTETALPRPNPLTGAPAWNQPSRAAIPNPQPQAPRHVGTVETARAAPRPLPPRPPAVQGTSTRDNTYTTQMGFPWPAQFYTASGKKAAPAPNTPATRFSAAQAVPNSRGASGGPGSSERDNDCAFGQGNPRGGGQSSRGRQRGAGKKTKQVAKRPLKRAYAESDSESSQGRKAVRGRGRGKGCGRAAVQEAERDLWGGVRH